MKRFLVSLLVLLPLISCAGTKVSTTQARAYTGPAIRVIALSPGCGVLCEAIGVELFNLGYQIVEPAETGRVVGRESAVEFEVASGEGLQALRARGVQALLVVKSVAGYDGMPQSATVRITSTADGTMLAAMSWQNAWGGMTGSPADRMMRKGLSEAAREIVKSLRKLLRS